ncbi:hypothetical protein K438DRAFT_2000264 [Mycena galopus ATCC 62051]|nr:hypothetical protein K438DRAFT_2000264 [Mycena galopus ATCC 62051]
MLEMGSSRATSPGYLTYPLSVAQLHPYIPPVSVYFHSLLYPSRSCPRAPNTLPLRLTFGATSTFTGYGPRPWPLPAAASNFPPRATPYPEALVVRHLQCSTGRTNFPYRTYSSSTDTRAAKPSRNPGRLCCLPPPTEP